MSKDFTDQLLDRWAAIRPELDVRPYEVTARISRLGTHIARQQEETFARVGLNRGEVGVLSALRIAPPPHRLSPTTLFRGLMLSSAGMTSRLDRLERRGFVKRIPDPDDRRGIQVELTPAGRKAVDDAVAANTNRERNLLGDMTAKEIEALARLLKKMLAGIEPGAID
jgi:DNA-binding MarR family transcriptional regulator